METLDAQLYKFVFITVAGMITGMVTDVFRAWRMCVRTKKIVRHITDALMVASVSCFLVVLVIHETWGEIRLYTLVGLISGWGCYFFLASPSFLWLFCRIFSLLVWVVGHIVRLVLIPINWLSRCKGKAGGEEGNEEEEEETKD